ncbi:hypothetical protein [Mesonia aestuariivivens]|uniref:Uncharacterized protein n=1 Tax=Mesonia aestuariivivens TaxID=2796128 RepID=A0ABS6W5Z0_9FLAO|nr:hypothetical protein [Mesonia aestuariivivens]MBW2962957.1 hypothetical protein [Mesonia aestuariivivens]
MEEITVIVYIISTFFNLPDSKLIADRTQVVIRPKVQEIEIIQNDLFGLITNEQDKKELLAFWQDLQQINPKKPPLAKELNNFQLKSFTIHQTDHKFQTHLVLKYSKLQDLRVLGIWYNTNKNLLSINEQPKEHIQTSSGKLDGNYWFFSADNISSYTVEPFKEMPESYIRQKRTIEEILLD